MLESLTLEQLAALLDAPDEEQRRSAVMELRRYPSSASRRLLLTALGDPSWRVRKEATVVLLDGACDHELIGMLVTALGAESNAGLRNAAVEALVTLGDTALPVLVSSLRDADRDTRKFIVDILGTIGKGDSRAALEELLADPDLNVATAAAESLGRLAAPESLPALVRALDSPSLWFRYAVLEAIAAIGCPVAAPVVVSLAEDRLLRGAVFDCLGAIGDIQALPLLMAGLAEMAPRLMLSASQALFRVRERLADAERGALDRELRATAGTELPLRLGDHVADGCEELVALLGIIGDPRTAGPLVRACREPSLQPHCVEALKGMADDIGPELAKLYVEGDSGDQANILWLCGEVGPSGWVALLLRGSVADSEIVRAAAMAAAGGGDDLALLPVVASGCVDPSPEVREEALFSLLRLAKRFPDRVVSVVEELAGSSEVSPLVRRRIQALRDGYT
jgi:HEAT repeat protein